jgi:DHA1 family bicyclomycin/chloramphenicol resistance-like MFS transporter
MNASPPRPDGDVRRPSLALLIVVSAVNPLAINIFMPSMPRLAEVFDTTYATVQLTLSVYLVVMALAQVVLGPLSDRYGRRPVLNGGLALFVVGSVVTMLAPSIEVMLAGRALQGAGGVAGIVLARAIVRDLYDRDRAAGMIGYVTMGLSVAPMVAPAIGGLLQEAVDWWASFAVMLGFGALALAWSVAGLHETNRNRGKSISVRETLADWAALFRIGAFWGYAFTTAFAAAVFFAFIGGAPYVTSELMHASPAEYGFYFVFVSLGYLIGNWISGRYAARFGTSRMITTGNLVQLAACAGTAAAFAVGWDGLLALFAPMFVVGIANGLTLPSAIAGMVSIRPDLAGAASGLGGAIQVGMGAIASTLAGYLLVHVMVGTAWSLIGLMLAFSLCAVLTQWTLPAGR